MKAMNLPTTNSTHYFVPVDGVIKCIKEMPEFPSALDEFNPHDVAHYENVILKPVIDNAIEVSNQKDVGLAILRSMRIGVRVSEKYFDEQITRYLTNEKVYSLQCRVEMKETPDNRDGKLVALVTFDQASEPEQEINSEELNKVFDWAKCGIYHNHAYHEEKLQACLDVLERFKNSISKSEPGDSEKGETQEQVFDALFCEYFDHIKSGMSGYTAVQLLKEEFVVTRKREVK